MSIFDSKQEILDIQLTSYGKSQLSKGKFNPSLYAFFDDNVVYDYSYASGSDATNGAADDRIRTQTPYLKTQHSLIGSEIKLNKQNTNQKITTRVTDYETRTLLKYPLGNSKIGEVTGSYIDTLLLSKNSSINNVAVTGTLNKFSQKEAFDIKNPKLSIKTLKFRPEFKLSVNGVIPDLVDPDSSMPPIVSPVLTDGAYVKVNVDDFLLYINEENSYHDFDNFEISVYKVETGENQNQTYKKLNFVRSPQSFVDKEGFLVESGTERLASITPDDVEFYFDISLDEEISPSLLNSRVPRDKLGAPIIRDPLIRNEKTFRERANFVPSSGAPSRTLGAPPLNNPNGTDDGDLC